MHASFSSSIAIYIFLNKSLEVHRDHLFGKSFITQFHGVHTAAVFFTELIEMITSKHYSTVMDKAMILHHTVGIYAFSLSAFGLGNYYLSLVLLSELSNPMLSARSLLILFNKGHLPIFRFVEYSFAATFISVRILLAYFYMTPIVLRDLTHLAFGYLDASKFPLWDGTNLEAAVTLARTCLLLMAVYHALNGYFLSHILKALIRNFQRSHAKSS